MSNKIFTVEYEFREEDYLDVADSLALSRSDLIPEVLDRLLKEVCQDYHIDDIGQSISEETLEVLEKIVKSYYK